jgi:hypothetical protein
MILAFSAEKALIFIHSNVKNNFIECLSFSSFAYKHYYSDLNHNMTFMIPFNLYLNSNVTNDIWNLSKKSHSLRTVATGQAALG